MFMNLIKMSDMKLVNIEIIKDELERLIRNYRFYSSTEAKYRYEAYKELSEWLDGLEVEEPSKDLKEAAGQYSFNIPSAIFNDLTPVLQNIWKREIEGAFIAGAKWHEKQIMNDAIEREVKEDAGGYPYIDATELYDYDNDKPLAKAGDKVKVIIMTRE